MVCKNCGAQVSNNHKRCHKCGSTIRHPKFALFVTLGGVVAISVVAAVLVIGFQLGKNSNTPAESTAGADENIYKYAYENENDNRHTDDVTGAESETDSDTFEAEETTETEAEPETETEAEAADKDADEEVEAKETDDVENVEERVKNPIPNVYAENACGENLTWSFDDSTSTLTISGEGEMWDFVYWDEKYESWEIKDTPWESNEDIIEKVVISDGVTSIGDDAFYSCDALTSIYIPDSVTSIGDAAFARCKSLASITIPDSVTFIGDCAFFSCDSLTSISIPDSVTSIGDGAFVYCYALTSITIPDSVTSIGDGAFEGCDSLTSIYVDTNNQYYCSKNGVLFTKDIETLICYPVGNKNTQYTIPDSVTSIGDYAFFSCDSLTSISIPDSVTSIGDSAFEGCDSLTTIHFLDTKEQWDALGLDSGDISGATVTFGK